MIISSRPIVGSWILSSCLWAAAGLADEGPDPAAVAGAIAQARLEPSRAVGVQSLQLQAGAAVLRITDGTVVPAVDPRGGVAEIVFVGRGELIVEPEDPIEEGQLDLFTGRTSLREELAEGVLVVAHDAAVDRLLRRDAPPDEAAVERARQVYEAWTERPERRVLGIEQALFRDALGDPVYAGYFAGWVQGKELGDLLWVFEPDEVEPFTLGQFTPYETFRRQEKKLRRALHRAQRRGRLVEARVEDLGTWDTWVSMPAASSSGRSFEPERYVLDVRFDGDVGIDGRAELRLRAQRAARILRLDLPSDLTVRAARDASGRDLYVDSNRGAVLVVLPDLVPAGEQVRVEVEWGGTAFDRQDSTFAQRFTQAWYPHAGSVDLATYEVTFRWPKRLDLVTGGRLVERGLADGIRFERRVWDHPTFAVSYEVGRLARLSGRSGEVVIELAIDPATRSEMSKEARESLVDDLAAALSFLEETFGPYGLDRLAVVTVPRAYSQSFHGFVTLASTSALGTQHWLTRSLGIEDRRTLIAHELAHQWWGHQVAKGGERDRWLSEAMASYAAVLYERQRLRDGDVRRVRSGPIRGWRSEVLATTRDGRPLESIGPLVLGARLASSRADAYYPIVYKKGAVVVDMLGRLFGEERFLEMLRRLIEVAAYRPASTEAFLDALSRLSGVDLDGFAQAFVYDTGLPEFYYRYAFEPGEEGTWRVSGSITRHVPFRYRFGLRLRPSGGLDVARERIALATEEAIGLAVPFRLAVYDAQAPESEDARKRRRRGLDPQEVGNFWLDGHLLVDEVEKRFELVVPKEPKELWLNEGDEIFARFFNERRYPKRMLYHRAIDAAGHGDLKAAEELASEALLAEVFVGPSYAADRSDREIERGTERSGRVSDIRIQILRSRLFLDQDLGLDARRAFAAAEALVDKHNRNRVEKWLIILEARLALHDGDPERAFELLYRPILKRGEIGGAEAGLLLAIAADEIGRTEERDEALRLAERRGADTSLLVDGW